VDVNENATKAPLKPTDREVQSYVNAGLAYLDRYGGPRARILRTLERRARRKGLETDAADRVIAAAMAKLDGFGVIDDAAFAASKARSLRGRGLSRRAALAKLRAAGLDGDVATAALAETDAGAADGDAYEDDAAAERRAAARYAERRRLGPWRADPSARAERRDRDIAAMARAGFSVSLAIATIDADDPEV